MESEVNVEVLSSAMPLGVSHYLRRAHNALRVQITEKLARSGIAMKHFHFLKALLNEDGITQVELSRRIGLERATVTVVLDEMQRLGMVRRARNKADRRKMHVFLTAKGRRTRQSIADTITTVQDIALRGISSEEYELFKRLVDKIALNCDTQRMTELQDVAS